MLDVIKCCLFEAVFGCSMIFFHMNFLLWSALLHIVAFHIFSFVFDFFLRLYDLPKLCLSFEADFIILLITQTAFTAC